MYKQRLCVITIFIIGNLRGIENIPVSIKYNTANDSRTNDGENIFEMVPRLSHFEKDDLQDTIRRKFAILDLRPKEECRNSNGIRTFYCPTPNPDNPFDWQCVPSDQLCNGIPDCPGAEDEDPTLCMFQLATQEQLRQLRKIIISQSEMISNSVSNNGIGQGYRSLNPFMATKLGAFPSRVMN